LIMAPTTSSQHEPEDTHATSGDGATTNGQRRALSKADWTTFHGTINMSSVNAHLPVNATVPKAFHLIHIPKSAGDSVMQDSPAHMAVGQTLKGNKELPYYATVHTEKFWNDPEDNQRAVVFLREPTSHIFSQFLECKYDTWGQNKTNGTEFPGFGELDDVMAGFDDWISHFANTTASHTADYIQHGRNPKQFAYNCYDPWNMQARYLTLNNDTFFQNVHFVPSAAHARQPPLQVAMANLHNPKLILGITSYYAASMCLLEYHALGGQLLTEACRTCGDGKLALTKQQHHDKHGVPAHSTKMITNPVTQHYIQQLTRVDQELYEYALNLFVEELNVVQNTTGIDLRCGRPIKVAPTTKKITRTFGMAPQSSNGLDLTPMLVILALAYGYYWRCCFKNQRKSRHNSITPKWGNSSSKSELSMSYRAMSVSSEGDDSI